MKRLLAMLLAAVMLLSLVGCGASGDPTEAKNGFYEVCGVYYPEELGAPALGEAVVEIDFSEAVEQITNVGDALQYVSSIDQESYTVDISTLFASLIVDDYDEVGMIELSCITSWEGGPSSHAIIYIREGDDYYPFDPCCMKDSEFIGSKKESVAVADIDSLTARMKASYSRPTGFSVDAQVKNLSEYGDILVDLLPVHAGDTLSVDGEEIPMRKGLDEDAVREKLLALTAEEYSTDDMQGFADADLTLAQATETFSKPQDAINYLRARGFYVDYAQGTGIEYNGVCWVWNPSAEFAFSHNAAHCAGTANIMNRLLAGDHESQGYVNYVGNPNCHIFNYFYEDGLYFFCDFTGDRNPITRPDYNDKNKYCYILYITDDPMDFSTYYMQDHNDISSTDYITHLECYEADGEDIMPTGFSVDPALRQYTENGDWLMDVLPLKLEEKMQMLFIRDGYTVHFAETPPDELRPSEDNIPTDAEFNMKYGAANE